MAASMSTRGSGSWLPPVSGLCRELLEIGATLGPEFDAELAARVLGEEDPLTVVSLIREAVEVRVLRPGGGNPTLRFQSEALRERLYAGLAPARRALLRQRIARQMGAMQSEA